MVRHDTIRPQLPALLAHRHADHLPGRVVAGTCEVTDFRDRLVELNQEINWIPDHVRDGAVRQLARGRPRLVDQPQPLLGLAHPGVAERRPGVPPHRRLRQPRRARGRLRRPPRRPAPARRSTTSSARTPTTRPGKSMMRRVPEVLDCWFESGSMPFAQVHYPFENKDWFERPLPRRLHRRVHRPDPRLVLHAARAVDGAVRPAGVPERDLPRRRARRGRPQALQAAAQLPRPRRGLRDPSVRRAALVPDVLADPARRRPADRRGRAGIADVVRLVLNPIWNAYHFFTPLRERRRLPGRRSAPTPPTLLDRYILAKTHDAGRAGHRGRSTPTTSPAPAPRSQAFLDALNNWYIRRSRDRFWAPAGRRRHGRRDKADAYDTLYTVLVTLCRVAAPLLPLLAEEISPGPGRRRAASTWPTGRRSTTCPADDELVARDGPGARRSPPPRCRCARTERPAGPPAAAELTVAGPTPPSSRRFVDLIATRST